MRPHAFRLKALKALFLSIAFFSAFSGAVVSAATSERFPSGPDAQLTPGEVCHNPTEYRYRERVPYCKRDVDSSLKRDIIATYDKARGFEIQQMDRQQFKIDHLIPLCMGGSNERDNLWPQHRSIYEITDPMEPLACEKMQAGVLLQSKAIELIMGAKKDLSKVPDVMKYLSSL